MHTLTSTIYWHPIECCIKNPLHQIKFSMPVAQLSIPNGHGTSTTVPRDPIKFCLSPMSMVKSLILSIPHHTQSQLNKVLSTTASVFTHWCGCFTYFPIPIIHLSSR